METYTTIVTLHGDNVTDDLKYYFEEAIQIKFNNVIFNFSKEVNFFIPFCGENFGFDCPIVVQDYDWKSFLELLKGFLVNLSFSREVNIININSNLIKNIEEHRYIDFIETVKILEKENKIFTKSSQSWMSTSELIFTFDITNINDHDKVWHEVDILGTSLGSQETKEILKLWNS